MTQLYVILTSTDSTFLEESANKLIRQGYLPQQLAVSDKGRFILPMVHQDIWTLDGAERDTANDTHFDSDTGEKENG